MLIYFKEDNVLTEARNLRNMTMAQTPLLGDENTPLHAGPAGGTGFEGATPRHHVAFTPNPLATPLHGDDTYVSATPRTDGRSVVAGTPLRTPMRDNLSINPEGFASIADTPRDQRLHNNSAKRALKVGFMGLPKPENNFELLVPEDEEGTSDLINGMSLSEEDAAERDAKLNLMQKEVERKTLARRSQVIQLGLPRPADVDVRQLLQDLSMGEDDESEFAHAQQLINVEFVQLLQHDSIAHPIAGTSRPGGTRSTYEIPPDEDVETAKSEIQFELASAVGFPNANPDQLRQGLLALFKTETVDEMTSWAFVRQRLALDATTKTWLEPSKVSVEERIVGYISVLDECRDLMTKDANKASKAEKKLTVTLGGYQARSTALSKRIMDAFDELQKTKVDYESFFQLQLNEAAIGPRRVSALREELDKLERREKRLQERYSDLDAERKESQARLASLDERVMADAEALNEAHLAEMDGVEDV
jgi:pre-mRNA-splicing factor CDC5/CEF1